MLNLAVVGAGPKAVSVAAKAKVLADMGVDVPQITIIDPLGVGANWSSAGGWTDGAHLLGTLPEKDCGFPYACSVTGDPVVDAEVDRRMIAVSWTAFKASRGDYGPWVDRGRPNPTHDEFSAYLRWVADQSGVSCVSARVTEAEATGEGWVVSTDSGEVVHSSALLITGPGSPHVRFADVDGLVSPADFWSSFGVSGLPTGRIGVIGGGETAASIIDELVRHRVGNVEVISPTACLYSRGENQFENELYSDPSMWADLDEQARRDVLSRTDRGVFSLAVLDTIRAEGGVSHIKGIVDGVSAQGGRVAVTVSAPLKGTFVEMFDYVVDARGSSPMWFTELLGERATQCLEQAAGGVKPQLLEASIGRDLAVTGMTPTLFLPSFAGFNQGPGFANLSCLGHLSARILAGCGVAGGAALSVD